jgi:hypothetical protein
MRGEYESRVDFIKLKGWGFPQPFFIIFLLPILYESYMLLSF